MVLPFRCGLRSGMRVSASPWVFSVVVVSSRRRRLAKLTGEEISRRLGAGRCLCCVAPARRLALGPPYPCDLNYAR
jgi:hypothetical protein